MTRQDLRLPARAFLPPPSDPNHLRALAASAMEAARSVGVSYADIRIGEQQTFGISVGVEMIPTMSAEATLTYGIRVLQNERWGFAYGSDPSVDAITQATRTAAARIQYEDPDRQPVLSLAPYVAVTDEWTSPCLLSPWHLSIDEQTMYLGSFTAAIIRGGGLDLFSYSHVNWTVETRVVASTDGAMITQVTTRQEPRFIVAIENAPNPVIDYVLPEFGPNLAGYESLSGTAVYDQIVAASEAIVHRAMLPTRDVEVGRYPLVTTGRALGILVGKTMSPALELDRVQGLESDASGTSYLSPPDSILNAAMPTFSPQLTVTSEGASPTSAGLQWDDEAVPHKPFSLIEGGHVVDYLTTRQTAPIMAAWYAKRAKESSSHPQARGCLTATRADHYPTTSAGHLRVTSANDSASVDVLARDIGRGFILYGAEVDPDPGLATALVYTGMHTGDMLLEVQRGKVVGRVPRGMLSLRVNRFLGKSLAALGDSSTYETAVVSTSKGYPWQTLRQLVTAPAALFTEVDIVNGGLHT